MITTFDKLYRQLGRSTLGLLVAALSLYAITLLCALLGLSHAVASLGGVAASLAYACATLFGVFLLASLGTVLIRYLDRRHRSGSI